MQMYEQDVLLSMNEALFTALIEKYTTVHPFDTSCISAKFLDVLQPLLEQTAKNVKEKLLAALF